MSVAAIDIDVIRRVAVTAPDGVPPAAELDDLIGGALIVVIGYLERVDPQAADRARQRYGCFDHVSPDDGGQAYGRAAAFGAGKHCETEVIEQLKDAQRQAFHYARRDGRPAEDEAFYAEQNARTRALEPLEPGTGWIGGEVPESYPSGL